MRIDDPNIEEFQGQFNTDNSFISTNKGDMKTTAVKQLKILKSEGCTVVVTDPYLFPESCDSNYYSDLLDILISLRAKKVIVYGDKSKINKKEYSRIETELKKNGCNIESKELKDCHDRFWLCLEKDKAVVFGTSLNGLGKKICRINELDEDEIAKLKEELINRKLL